MERETLEEKDLKQIMETGSLEGICDVKEEQTEKTAEGENSVENPETAPAEENKEIKVTDKDIDSTLNKV